MQELLNLILQINDETNYTAALRYTPHKLKKGAIINSFAVDVMLGDTNVFHSHYTDFQYIPKIIKEIKEKLDNKTTYQVNYTDNYMHINYKATSYYNAVEMQNKFNNRYGIEAEIVEVLDDM